MVGVAFICCTFVAKIKCHLQFKSSISLFGLPASTVNTEVNSLFNNSAFTKSSSTSVLLFLSFKIPIPTVEFLLLLTKFKIF